MPELYADTAKNKVLFGQWFRCTGCNYCLEVCPKDVLISAAVRNVKLAYPPQLKEETACSFCRNCELVCPHHAIYVVEAANG
ncbi:MAG: 4Fe-4S dicluster domain-containing protein [bacterium]|nr:4Fe-4S dicluster domain-containing protein [bacterium]